MRWWRWLKHWWEKRQEPRMYAPMPGPIMRSIMQKTFTPEFVPHDSKDGEQIHNGRESI